MGCHAVSGHGRVFDPEQVGSVAGSVSEAQGDKSEALLDEKPQ